jgi:hypothetical protein
MRTSSTHASASLTANAAEAAAFAEQIIADAKSGAFRGLVIAYVCAQGPVTLVTSALWFDRADLQTAILLGGEIYDLASLGRTAAPDASPSPSRVN